MTLHFDDCLVVLAGMAADSIDACVTDPPYELGFMAKKWDKTGIAYRPETWAAVLRVLKPGAHMLAFGGTRTHHRMVCAIEDAGFEIRDEIDWIYGQGFPKSLNFEDGWGTALKPAKEPICLARKPFAQTVEKNLAQFGTGGINIDGCRVASDARPLVVSDRRNGNNTYGDGLCGSVAIGDTTLGRWPANVIHDGSDEVLAAFPAAPGQQGASIEDGAEQGNNVYGAMRRGGPHHRPRQEADKSAARFFYCAKATKSDREEGLDRYEIVIAQCSAWENADQKAVLRVDTAQSPPRVIGVCGAPNNSASEWNTFLFGNQSTDLSLMGSKSIIRTKTNSITSLKTLSFFQTKLINGYTADADGSEACAGSHVENADALCEPMIITSDVAVLARGAVRAASQAQWKISVSDACPPSSAAELVDREPDTDGMNSPRAGAGRTAKNGRRNTHCTVKPTDLMRYLCRLVTPKGGTILDPFMGSGSTGKAALLEGFDFIGIEKDATYTEIAKARIAAAKPPMLEVD